MLLTNINKPLFKPPLKTDKLTWIQVLITIQVLNFTIKPISTAVDIRRIIEQPINKGTQRHTDGRGYLTVAN
jgi:hypothetical protein